MSMRKKFTKNCKTLNIEPDPFNLVYTINAGAHKYNEVKVSETQDEQVSRVSANSSPQSVASAVAHSIYETRVCKIRAVGAGAVNQAVKAIAIARGYVAPRGLDLVCVPGFASIESHDGTISAIVFTVLPQ